MIEAIAHTSGYAFRLVTIGIAVVVLATWVGIAIAWTRGYRASLTQREIALLAAVIAFASGFFAIQVEAVFIAPDAILLWGNFLFPLGLGILLAWEVVLIRLLKKD